MIDPELKTESELVQRLDWPDGQETDRVSLQEVSFFRPFSPAAGQAVIPVEGREKGAAFSDLIKVYLQDMGQISLLSKENEVELARKIERAEMSLITALLKTDLSLEAVELLYEEIKNKPDEVGRWFNLPENDYSPTSLNRAAQQALVRLDSIRKLSLKLKSLPANKKTQVTRARLGVRIRQQVIELEVRWDKKYELVDKIKKNLRD